jgi:pyruvate dehydrogenase E1 component alpha subunit
VHKTAEQIVKRVRAGDGPLFVEARTHLWPGNAFNMPKLVGGITDIAWAWNPSAAPEKVRDWHKAHDPILNYCRELESAGVSRGEIEKLDAQVREEADEAARFALESPLPDAKAALNYAFAGKGN